MVLDLNLERVKANVRKADTEDLLDRATVYRNGMEPEALDLIDEELRRRGVGEAEVRAHEMRRARTIHDAAGLAVKCVRCHRPAVMRRWTWHRLWGVLPLFPRQKAYCEAHLSDAVRATDDPTPSA